MLLASFQHCNYHQNSWVSSWKATAQQRKVTVKKMSMPLDITKSEASSFLPPLASIPIEKPQYRLDLGAACRPIEISHSDEQSSLAGPAAKRIKVEVLKISSSSLESEEQTAAEKVASNKRRRPHALKMAEFPA